MPFLDRAQLGIEHRPAHDEEDVLDTLRLQAPGEDLVTRQFRHLEYLLSCGSRHSRATPGLLRFARNDSPVIARSAATKAISRRRALLVTISGQITPSLRSASTSPALIPSHSPKTSARVLSEQRGGLELWRLPVKAHRPGRHLERAGRVLRRLQDAALGKARLVHQFHRVEHRTGRHPGGADQAHRLVLVAPLCPIGDHRVDLFDALAAGLRGLVARVADQILAAEKLEQPVPVVLLAGKDIDPVIGAARRAGKDPRRRRVAAVAVAGCRPAEHRLRLKREADVVQHRVLHRHLEAPALAGGAALVERAEDADRHHHAGAGVAERNAGPDRRPVRLAGDAHRAAGGLRDHVEGEVLLVGAALAEALDLGIDDAGVQRADRVIAEPQPLDRSGRHVLDHDVGLLGHVLDQSQAALGFEIDRDRLLVGVEFEEIERVGAAGSAGKGRPAGLAAIRVLDLDDLGAEPGERLGAGGARLELGQVEHPNPGEAIEGALFSVMRISSSSESHVAGSATKSSAIAAGAD